MQIEIVIQTLTKAVKAFKDHQGNKEYAKKTLDFLKAAKEINIDFFSAHQEQTLGLRLRIITDALWDNGNDYLALKLQINS